MTSRTLFTAQHCLGRHGVDALGQRRALDQIRRMVGIVTAVHLEAHNLAAVHVQDQLEGLAILEPYSQSPVTRR